MSSHFGDLEELIEFGLSNDGSNLFDQQQTSEAPVQQTQQRQHYNYINVDDAVVVGNVYEDESMECPEEDYQVANNITIEESHQTHRNNNVIFDSRGFLLLNQEDASNPSDDNDINGLEEHLLDDDNEMLADDNIIFEDQITPAPIPTTSRLTSSASTSARTSNGGKVGAIKIEAATTFSAAYETGYEFEKITKWDPSSSYAQKQTQTPTKYKVLHDGGDDIAGNDDDNDDGDGDILQEFSNDSIKDEEIEIEDASEATIVDDIIIEDVIELESISTTKNLINSGDDDDDADDDDAVVPVSLIKTVIDSERGGKSSSSSSVRSVRMIQTELQQNQQQDTKSKSARTRIPTIDAPQRPQNSKRKTIDEHKGPLRYMLYDELIATIVDFDADETPIVEFSMSSNKSDNRLPVECGICPEVMTRSKLPAHLKIHHVPETNRYACIYCEESYRDSKYLAGHARRHMGIRPYVCGECKLYFSTKQDLRVHNQRRHIEKEHTCEICGKNFAQNTQLKRHRESMHEKKRRFHCPVCPKAYYKNFSLQEHIRNVHMGKRRMLVCPFCGMQCRDAHKMAKHRKENHLNQSVFVCHVCCEEFTDINYFDAHKRSIQCRSNTKRKQECNDEDALINSVDNVDEASTKTKPTTNKSSYSINKNLNSSNSLLEQHMGQRHKHQSSSQKQQQNHHHQVQYVNTNGIIDSIVPDVVDDDDEPEEAEVEMEEEEELDEDEQYMLVERLVDEQDDLIYEVTLG